MKNFFYFNNKFFLTIIILLVIFFAWKYFSKEKRVLGISNEPKQVILNDNNFTQKIETNTNSVKEFLDEQQVYINDHDFIYPNEQTILFSGMTIKIERAKKISVFVDNKKQELYGFKNTVAEILRENKINFKEEDIVKPSRETFAYNNLEIEIVRVEIKEEIAEKNIKFKTIYKEDNKLNWRKEKIKQKGAYGVKKIKYQVAYHNGKEISRKILSTEIAEKPVSKIIVKGSYIKFGKSHKGVASWYAYTGTMSAANPWLPMGSYVKVTNRDNGKSVIVKINDRGPFGNGRIIDLDKVAFAKIANLGQGTANIKMEEILN